jgi:hypothetical protein
MLYGTQKVILILKPDGHFTFLLCYTLMWLSGRKPRKTLVQLMQNIRAKVALKPRKYGIAEKILFPP